MFPRLSELKHVETRPRNITATGKTGGYDRWSVTEFESDNGVKYYKHQKFNYGSKDNFFEERWYTV